MPPWLSSGLLLLLVGTVAMADDLSGYNRQRLWSSPGELASEMADRLLDAGLDGIRLLAPETVPLDGRSTLPTIAIVAGTYEGLWKLEFNRRALITAMDVEANQLGVAYAVDQDRVYRENRGTPSFPEGTAATTARIELRERLGLAWEAGRLVARVIVRDTVSNDADIQLGRSTASYVDPEVVKYRAEQRRLQRQVPLAPKPAADGSAVSYRRQAASPPVPEKPGIALAAERVQRIAPDMRCLLHGSFRLPTDAAAFLRPESAQASGMYTSEAAAILPITLLLTGSVTTGPRVHRLMVPAWAPAKDGLLSGSFTIDLCRMDDVAAAEQTWFVYAFSGAVMGGALPIALVR